MKVIDLRSDTKTLPTEEMRRAMYEAEVGDDVSREDPTVNCLEELAAHMLKKESTLFTPSGIMSNLLAVLTHTHPGEEILLGSESHMFWYEVEGPSALGGVVMRTIPNEQDGRVEPHVVEEVVRPEEVHEEKAPALPLETLDEPIKRLLNIGTVQGAFICSKDGLLIQDYCENRRDVEEMSALIAAIHNEAEQSSQFLKAGNVEKFIIEKGDETICVLVTVESLFTVITEPEAKPGLVFVYARKIIDEIKEILG